MYCERCGAQNPDGTPFCANCGAPLQQTQPQGLGGGNPVLATIRAMAGGGLFLTCAIAYSLSLLFQLLSSVRGASQLSALLGRLSSLGYLGGGYYDPRMEILSRLGSLGSGAFATGHIFGTVLVMLPSILIAVGLWMVFASAKGDGPMGTAGLTMIRVICIISMVFLCLLFLILEIGLIIAAVAASNGYERSMVPVLVGVIIGVLIIAVVCILYQVKLIGTVAVMRSAIQSGKPRSKVSTFVAVMNYISGGFTVLSALAAIATSGIMGFLQVGAMATALICFGMIIFSYKSRMELIKQGGVPEIALRAQAPMYQGAAPMNQGGAPMNQGGAPMNQGGASQWQTRPPVPPQSSGYQNYGGAGGGWSGAPQPERTTVPPQQGNRPAPPETTVLRQGENLPGAGGKLPSVVRLNTGASYPVTTARFRIGRDYDAELCIEDNTVVGRKHAEIVFHDGAYFLVDQHSSNHSYINNMELDPGVEYKLDYGTEFVLGNEAFRFEQ